LTSRQGALLDDLVVTVQLMDDFGTVNINITTVNDYNNNTMIRIPYVTDYSKFNQSTVTKNINDFFTFNSNPFYYSITEEKQPANILW
jgi:hypothetical protein